MSGGDDRTWAVQGDSDDGLRVTTCFTMAMEALRFAAQEHAGFSRSWDPGVPVRCPDEKHLAAARKFIATIVLDLLSGGVLSVTRPDDITAVVSLLGLLPETGLILRESRDAAQ